MLPTDQDMRGSSHTDGRLTMYRVPVTSPNSVMKLVAGCLSGRCAAVGLFSGYHEGLETTLTRGQAAAYSASAQCPAAKGSAKSNGLIYYGGFGEQYVGDLHFGSLKTNSVAYLA